MTCILGGTLRTPSPLGLAAIVMTLVKLDTLNAQPAGATAVVAQSQGKPSRHFENGTWAVVRRIGLDDDLFDNPGAMAVDDNRVVVFDFGANVVKSVRLDGTLEWTAGGKGRGPGEYLSPATLRLDSAGRAIVYDPEAGRITILSRNGKLVAAVPLTQRFEMALPGPASNHFLLLNSESDTLAALVDTGGQLRAAMRAPDEFQGPGRIARELNGSVSSSRGHLIAFRWTSRMIQIDRNGSFVRSCMAIDSLSLPPIRQTPLTIGRAKLVIDRVDAKAKAATQSITTLGGSTVVLRPGVVADSQKVVDLYGPDCGRYVASRRLPVRTRSISGNNMILVALVEDPVPHLLVLRWVASTIK